MSASDPKPARCHDPRITGMSADDSIPGLPDDEAELATPDEEDADELAEE
jgi:hypothetical protein